MRNVILTVIGIVLAAAAAITAVVYAPDLTQADRYVARQVTVQRAQAAQVDAYTNQLEGR